MRRTQRKLESLKKENEKLENQIESESVVYASKLKKIEGESVVYASKLKKIKQIMNE